MTTLLLKNGTIVDGTGKTPAFAGSLLLRNERIDKVIKEGETLPEAEEVVDCTGKVIAPGVVDAHSHHDWFMSSPTIGEFLKPFIMQGVTTFVGGNCGFSVAGHKKNSSHKDIIKSGIFGFICDDIKWDSIESYYAYIEKIGIPSNLAMFAGHGTIRQSINGSSVSPLTDEQMAELLSLLEQAMDDGAIGVSLGLMYEPGIFTPMEELEKVCELVARKGKVLSIHPKVMTAISGIYDISPAECPHNILFLKEMLEVFKRTDCRVQWSHLLFCGRSTWQTEDAYMAMQDQAVADGLDLCFDIYAYDCGTSIITVSFPQWYMEQMPGALDDPAMRDNLKKYFDQFLPMAGFTFDDIQVRQSNVPGLEKYNGWFVPDIAKDMGLEDCVDAMIALARGPASVLQYAFSNQEIVNRLSAHPQCLYATDAWLEPGSVQNPASYGNFPRFIQMAREERLLSMEQVIHKMSGFAAERFGLRNRGHIQQGCYADIMVLDWENVRDNNTRKNSGMQPGGIVHVLVNGRFSVKDGTYQNLVNGGMPIRSED